MSSSDTRLRNQLVALLEGGHAHVTFDNAVANVNENDLGRRMPQPKNVSGRPHTIWRLVEHMRIAQHDLLEYVRNPKHVSPDWPDGYWPEGDAPTDKASFERTCDAFRADVAAFRAICEDENIDPLAPIPHANNTTLVRNVTLVATHTSYHLGELVLVRKTLGIWK